MLESIHIKNFKCFEDTGKIKIYPITLLVGPNSAGKSSFIQPLLALKQTKESQDSRNTFIADGRYVDLGLYDDFIFNHLEKENFFIGIGIKTKFPKYFSLYDIDSAEYPSELKFSINLTYGLNRTKKNVELREVSVFSDPNSFEFNALKLARSNFYNVDFKSSYTEHKQPLDDKLKKMENLRFYGFSGSRYTKTTSKIPRLRVLMYIIQQEIEKFFDNFLNLKPLRENPKRIYIISGARPADVGVAGELATNVLFFSTKGKSKEKKLYNLANSWSQKLGIASQVKFKVFKAAGVSQLNVISPYNELEANICDVGFGVSQVLPIIVQGLFSPENSTLVIEQPEIHLHPNIQANLGNFFVELAKNHSKTVIIETHSEHLISRIRRLVGEGMLASEMLGIYYFQVNKDRRCEIKKLEINGLGQTINWPEGFFEEDYKEAFEHSKIIAQRKGKDVEAK